MVQLIKMEEEKIHLTDEQITQYATILVSKTEFNLDKKVIEHVEECEKCKKDILELVNIVNNFEDKNTHFKVSKNMKLLYSMAISILLFIIGYYFYPFENNNKSKLLTENIFLEELVNQNLRAGYFRIIQPKFNDEINSNSILFKWESDIKNITLILLDNTNKILLKEKVVGNKIKIKNDLPKGLIYWKVESDEDLIFVSKFINKY